MTTDYKTELQELNALSVCPWYELDYFFNQAPRMLALANKLAARVEELEADREWQPIEQFEDDGKIYWFWLIIHEDFEGMYGQSFMPKKPELWFGKYRGWPSTQKATHFMHYFIPKPPKKAGDDV